MSKPHNSQVGQKTDDSIEVNANAKQPLAPGIAKGLELPYALNDWYLFKDKWFESGIYDFFADLPTNEWENPTAFAEGAIRVVERLLQKTSANPFRLCEVQNISRRKINMVGLNSIDQEDLGVITFTAQISLNANESRVVDQIKEFLATERKKRGIVVVSARPAQICNLQRDFVVYVLDRERWDINSIQIQLKHMGSLPFPEKTDPKLFVRKVRSRFSRIEEEIALPAMERIDSDGMMKNHVP